MGLAVGTRLRIYYILGVDTRVVVAAFEVDYAGADIFLLALAGFALAVEVPDWFGEGLEDIGSLFSEGVVDMVRGDDVGFASFEGSGDAEETDNVGVVGVEELAGFFFFVSLLCSFGWIVTYRALVR